MCGRLGNNFENVVFWEFWFQMVVVRSKSQKWYQRTQTKEPLFVCLVCGVNIIGLKMSRAESNSS
jgi:hypothetical protein